ncbi:MAG TPA: diaminopimelate epimerase [Alphaproteobacteria bacterium]|jgi:diaminopimelate epimerase|nr:diaminopimelate epimerase [Alphaproteobacteria bacterium]MDP6270366.1 diaminopimelate epimerase [Alphaproteobacteria bacterium]MDP7164799.1 diaminopimelate epimerase [Alphaproteobacteria bacterium]MDP7429296.1 diaminopimelate epimerase [Alphaproteobacteria bacterium]HJM49236.1 diaminopimelate epimerase [Alphaproteobacteria bacterium]|tara:strand:+ start:353 stop:1180 length:828 start_codon:yes stop_codon:yes gene_type:complete
MAIPFVKMHGLGNDFVVVDIRPGGIVFGASQIRAIADRRRGIGCDQFITLEPSQRGDVFMRIHNADGGEVEACGNATRCVARSLMDEMGRDRVAIETGAGLLETMRDGDRVTVDMGRISFAWRDIPLAHEADTMALDLGGELGPAVAVYIGNPHAVFFVEAAEAVDLERLGPEIEHHELYPQRTNVEAAQVIDRRTIRLRVWERGVGITKACGTGACASAAAAARRGLTERSVTVHLDGGPLEIEWVGNDHALMTGPANTSFRGLIDDALLQVSS